ncbi:MAG: leucyl aminopeptidase [Candidatus Omnitrophota bacterium]|jgi:leucyl aminopeptidase
MLKFHSTAAFSKDLTLVLVTEAQLKNASVSLPTQDSREIFESLSNNSLFKAERSQTFTLVHKKNNIIFLGLGSEKVLTQTGLRIILRTVLLSDNISRSKSLTIIPHTTDTTSIISIVESIYLGTYEWSKYKTASKNIKKLTDKVVTLITTKNSIVTDAIKVCDGVTLARDLVNENADITNSKYFEKVVREVILNHKNTKLTILNRKELTNKGLKFHLAVNQASVNEPKLIIVDYKGAGAGKPYTAFIGKGLTFDTGGLNLKPSGNIESMRLDMAGAAAVVGTLKNTLSLKLKKNILFVIGVAENVTGSKSYKPGDVLKGYAGITVEVLNTDAEGRLVLADAISYIVKNYKPIKIIDIATLTGACIVALGHDYTAVMANNDQFANQILNSAEVTDDRAWQLPIYPELKENVKSSIADIANLGQPKGAGGSITAGEFLRQFVGKTQWVHLDIAGTSFVDGPSRMYFGHGATGSGVRLVTHYLKNN